MLQKIQPNPSSLPKKFKNMSFRILKCFYRLIVKYPPKIKKMQSKKILNIPKNPSCYAKKITPLTLPKKMENISFKILKCFYRSTVRCPKSPPFKLFHFARSTFWCILVPWIHFFFFFTAVSAICKFLCNFRFLPCNMPKEAPWIAKFRSIEIFEKYGKLTEL